MTDALTSPKAIMNLPNDKQHPAQEYDSIKYCIDFWKDALDAEDEIDHFVREMPRHVRASDDLA